MKKHFFIIDDDEDEVQLIDRALSKIQVDHKCTWSKSGEEALIQLQYLIPDIIFVDYNMGRMDGLQCLQAIKKIANCANVPIILHSSCMNDQIRELGLQMGAYDCLNKSDSFENLVVLLQSLYSEILLRHHT